MLGNLLFGIAKTLSFSYRLRFGMEEGFILSNKFRKMIFDDVISGENDINSISRKNHISQKVARELADELVNLGILEKKGEYYYLTKEGEKLAEKLRNR